MGRGLDDDTLAAAFRAAVADTPEPGFGHSDVLAGSHRAARRHRMLVTGGIAAAVIVLAGGVTTGVVLGQDRGSVTSAASAPAQDSAGSGLAREAAPVPPALGGGCVNQQDPGLRSLVDAALPALSSATEAPTTMICRPGGGREVHLDVTDGALTGLFSVVDTPAGEQGPTDAALGWVQATEPTRSGGTVTVTSRASSDSGGVPYSDQVEALAKALAPLL
ncbi:hypothetical protein [Pseudonocardia ailaonensis]